MSSLITDLICRIVWLLRKFCNDEISGGSESCTSDMMMKQVRIRVMFQFHGDETGEDQSDVPVT